MRITRLHIQGIRQLADLDLKPAAGLTVVRGANESGKSTVQTALEMVLFHDPTSIAPALLDLRTSGTPSSSACASTPIPTRKVTGARPAARRGSRS